MEPYCYIKLDGPCCRQQLYYSLPLRRKFDLSSCSWRARASSRKLIYPWQHRKIHALETQQIFDARRKDICSVSLGKSFLRSVEPDTPGNKVRGKERRSLFVAVVLEIKNQHPVDWRWPREFYDNESEPAALQPPLNVLHAPATVRNDRPRDDSALGRFHRSTRCFQFHANTFQLPLIRENGERPTRASFIYRFKSAERNRPMRPPFAYRFQRRVPLDSQLNESEDASREGINVELFRETGANGTRVSFNRNC